MWVHLNFYVGPLKFYVGPPKFYVGSYIPWEANNLSFALAHLNFMVKPYETKVIP